MGRKERKPVYKVVMAQGKRNIIHQLLKEYDIQTAEDMQVPQKLRTGIVHLYVKYKK